jgi:tRNA threonylcarbamoyladenosine biosynthesis protein TsaB
VKILALDTSGNACSAALWRDGTVAAHVYEKMERGHTEALLPMINAVLRDAESDFDAIDWLAVTVGPGSFTGIRAGLAAARGIALARTLPVFGVDTFTTVLQGIRRVRPGDHGRRHRVIALDSRRKELYLQVFSAFDDPVSEPELIVPERAFARMGGQPVILAGSGASQLRRAMPPGCDVIAIPETEAPDAQDLATVAANRIAGRSPNEPLPPLAPLYLHPPYAKRPADGGRLRP